MPTSDAPARTVAVVLAGGTGSRLGGVRPKQLLEIAGRPIVEHAIRAFHFSSSIDEIGVVMAAGFIPEVERIVAAGGYDKVTRILEGGADRTDSTCRALDAIARDAAGSPDSTRAAGWRVLLHDAARPLVTGRIIGDCVEALATHDAVTVAVPSSDTMLEVADPTEGPDGLPTISRVPDRRRLRRAQTPQAFRLPVIRVAHERAKADPAFGADGPGGTGGTATDDCGLVLRYLPDVPIHVVPGSESNIKVTHAGDVALAETLMSRQDEAGRELDGAGARRARR